MSAIGTLALQTGAAIAGNVANQAGYAIGKATGYNKAIANDQYEQQKRLSELQYGMNLGLMKESYKSQMEMWNDTNYEAQVEHLKAAGLNPGLLYAKGGSGGTTGSGGASVSGGNASDETSRQQAQLAATGMGLQLSKLQSEIDLNKSISKKNEAEALQAGANTATIEQSRDWLVEKLKEEGKGQWIENIRKNYQDFIENKDGAQGAGYESNKYGQHIIRGESLFTQGITAEITQALASSNNQAAQALLTDQKAQGYFTELLNESIKADAAATQAAAQKLSAEFSTGEMINWKTWKDLAESIIKLILK